jgi:hypothetical protein
MWGISIIIAYCIVKQFEDTGNVCDKRVKKHELNTTVHTEDASAAREGQKKLHDD